MVRHSRPRHSLPFASAAAAVVAVVLLAFRLAPDLGDLWRLSRQRPETRITALRSIEARRPLWIRAVILDRALTDEAPNVRAYASLALLRLGGTVIGEDAYRVITRNAHHIFGVAMESRPLTLW